MLAKLKSDKILIYVQKSMCISMLLYQLEDLKQWYPQAEISADWH